MSNKTHETQMEKDPGTPEVPFQFRERLTIRIFSVYFILERQRERSVKQQQQQNKSIFNRRLFTRYRFIN